MFRNKRDVSAFTLIELSIVLVIIALIAGGIVGGKSLIDSARVSKTITEANSYRTAINTFLLQYDALPGDMRDATSYWSGVTNDGDGDGFISNRTGGTPDLVESADSWEHLSLAEIVDGTYTGAPGVIDGSTLFDFPVTPHGTHWWIQHFRISYLGVTRHEGNTIHTGINTTGYWCPGTPLSAVLSVEKKIDDGLPYEGKVMVSNQCDLSLPVCQEWSAYSKENAATAICALHFLRD